MKRFVKWMALLVALGGTSGAFAQTAAIQDHCTLGGTKANLSGLHSTNYMEGIVPSCTVTVYLTGTQTLATIYANGSGGSLANPFTANSATSLDPGGWVFWAAVNQGYDIVLSGGIFPNTYASPVTLVDRYPSFEFSGGGGVTLTGPVTGTGTGTIATTITPTGITAGSYNVGGQVLTYNAAGQLTAIGNPFAVSFASCSACGTFEIGNATTNPATFTLSYANGTPASASITDGTNTDTLTTPYTSGSIAAAYCTTGQGQASFTYTASATATNSQTASATTGTNCLPRVFGGVGTAGATGATASGTSAVLVGATGTLVSNGLGAQGSWGSYSPSNQKIYVLSVGSGCSFTSGGFDFPMGAPTHITFTNQYGASVGMYLYESTNLVSVPFTLAGSC